MKRIYLHIGYPKTGTTAIQMFLRSNWESLIEQGIYYPVDPMLESKRYPGNLLPLVVSLNDSLNNPDGIEYSAEVLYSRLIENVEKYDCPINIVSAEDYYRISSADITELHKQLRDYECKIIIYLRRQDKFVTSIYFEAVKSGHLHYCMQSEEELYENYDLTTLLYDSYLDRWIEVFGRENIIVRLYEPKRFPEGNVIFDFADIVGIDLEHTSIPDRINVSIDRETCVLLQHIYLMHGDGSSKNVRELANKILESAKSNKHSQGLISFLSPEQRKNFLNQFVDSNKIFADQFFKGHLFDLSDLDREIWEPFKGISPETIATLIRKVAG